MNYLYTHSKCLLWAVSQTSRTTDVSYPSECYLDVLHKASKTLHAAAKTLHNEACRGMRVPAA